MTGEVRAPKQMQPQTVGDSLILAGQQLAMTAPRTNFVPGCIWGGGFGGPIFPVPGYDAADIYARTQLGNIWSGLCNDVSCRNGASGATNSTGGVTTGPQEVEKTTNPADVFGKIKYEKIREMAKKEEAIKAKEQAIEDEKKGSNDSDKIEALSKELVTLQNEYKKLDKELGNGSQLSKSFGDKEYSFYANIQPEEYKTIGELNSAISKLKEELAKLDKEGVDLRAEMENVRSQLRSKAGAGAMFTTIDDQTVLNNMSAEKRDRMAKIKQEREDKITEISTKIDELKSYITDDVLKDDTAKTNVYTRIAGNRSEAAKEAKKKEGDNIASTIADKLYDENGNLRSKEDLGKLLDTIKGEKYKGERETVLDFIYTQAKATSKDKLKEAFADSKFFAEIIKSDSKFPLNNPVRIELLQKTYDKLVGEGKFAENFEKNNKQAWKGYKQALEKAKQIDNPSTAGSKESDTASPQTPVKKAEKELKDAEKRAEEEQKKAKAYEEKRKLFDKLTTQHKLTAYYTAGNTVSVDEEALKKLPDTVQKQIRDAMKVINENASSKASVQLAQKELEARKKELEKVKGVDKNERLTTFYNNIENSNNNPEALQALEDMDDLELARLVCEDWYAVYKHATYGNGDNKVQALGIIVRKMNKAAAQLGVDPNKRFHFTDGVWDSLDTGIDNITNSALSDKDIGELFTSTFGLCDSSGELYAVSQEIKKKLEETDKAE